MHLVRTRLRPPVRGTGLIDRRRLAALVDQVRCCTLTFIKAPAGYGKSSTLCQWFDLLAGEGAAVGWLSLEVIDSDVADFFTYLVAALRESRPEFGKTVELRASSPALPTPQAFGAAFVDDVLAAGEDVFLFIDDFHLITDPGIGEAVSSILGHPPGNLHLVVASRQSPPFSLSRLRLRGLLAEVDADLLRFDHGDAGEFLRLAGHELSDAELDTLVTMTEGWAAAIQLAAISLGQGKDNFFSLVSGEQEEMSQFLAEDVIKNLPARTVEFVERTAVLSRLNADLCTALTGFADAREQIDAIMRQSLFLFSLDQEDNWYRYHHFFAAFLRRRLRDREPALIPRLHCMASDWFAGRGHVEEAFAHAVEGGDYGRAAAILEKSCTSLFYDGRLSTLLRWSRRIPDAVLVDYPRIRLEIAWSIILEWRFSEAARILAEVEASIPALARLRGEDWRRGIDKIVMHRKMMLYLFMDDMPNAEAVITAGHGGFPDDDPYLQGNVETCLIYARREMYQLDGIRRRDALAREYYERSGSTFVLVWHESAVGPSYFQMGEPDRAVSSLSLAMDIAEKIEGATSSLRAMPALLLAEILYEQNECQTVAALIGQYGGEAEKKGFVDHLVAYYITRSRLAFRAGDHAAARQTLSQARLSAERRGFERLLAWVDREELRQSLALDDFSKARAVLEMMTDPDLAARLEPGAQTTSRDEALALAWARASIALGDCAEAARLLRCWAKFARERKAVRSEVRILIALSIGLLLSGTEAEALRTLREAVERAARARFIRCFLDEGKVIETLLRMLFREDREIAGPAASFGRELLVLFGREPGCGEADADTAAGPIAPEALNQRERQVLRMVACGLSNKEIGRRLDLTEGSVKWYMQQVFMKLDVRRRSVAVRRAEQFGML